MSYGALVIPACDNADTKQRGIHYTPDELARFLARQAVDFLPDGPIRVLDPACGDGVLLEALAEAAGSRVALMQGFDTDPVALHRAELRLGRYRSSSVEVKLECGDFLSEMGSVQAESGQLFGTDSERLLQSSFDIVIANPPYVRTQVLGSATAQSLARAFGLSGRVDLYHAFVIAMTTVLRAGGVLALLCSNRFLTTRSGQDLRRLLATNYKLHGVYDLGDTKLFAAAVLPAVVIGSKSEEGSRSLAMTSVYLAPKSAEPSLRFASVVSSLGHDGSDCIEVAGNWLSVRKGVLEPLSWEKPWVVISSGDSQLITRLGAATSRRFKDVAAVKVGIKTTCDEVFIRSDWSDMPATERPEDELLLPILTHREVSRWKTHVGEHRVLYPYDLSSERRRPLDLAQFPRARRYLESHRERLSARRYVQDGGRLWWEIWVPQRPSLWRYPKMVFPDISESPRFSLDRSGAIVNGDCYWVPLMTLAQQQAGRLMVAIANSTFGTWYYDRVCGNRLYAGRRRYITQYVEDFPLPDQSSDTSAAIREVVETLASLAGDSDRTEIEAELDRLVWRSFGLEQPSG